MNLAISRGKLAGVLLTTMATALLVGLFAPFRQEIGLVNVGLVFVLLTLLVSAYWGSAVGLYTALLTNLAYNFFFIEPHFTFTVQAPQNVVALIVSFAVSIVGGTLLSRAREAAAEAKRRQAETEVALRLSRAMGGQAAPEQALQALCQEVTESFAAPAAAVLTQSDGAWQVLAHAGVDADRAPDTEERAAADRAVQLGEPQGLGSTGLNGSRSPRIVVPRGRASAYSRDRSVSLVPLMLGDRVLGVLRVDGPIGDSPFRDHPERLLGAVASEAAEALQRAELAKAAAHAEALKQADEMKSALMASISHDLKTPLAGIKAAISSLIDKRMKWSTDDITAFHETIDSQTDRLNRVISDILDLNRLQSGALTPEKMPVSALDLLEQARAITSFETKGRNVTVEAPPSLTVLSDESLITQALVNLIENAVKYATPETPIHLKATGNGDYATLIVEDEGPGIAPQDLSYVFERFYRAEEHSRRVKGSGLGLTIVKGFVELSGGKVRVESSPAGTRFMIQLPAEPAKMPV